MYLGDYTAVPYIGKYLNGDTIDTAQGIKYPTPVKTTQPISGLTGLDFLVATEESYSQNYNPSVGPPGELGLQLKYYPYFAGPFQDTQEMKIWFKRIWDGWAQYKIWYD